MSTAHPDSHSPDRLVKVEVLQTVEEVNSRGPMTAAAFEVFAAANGRCELLGGKVKMMSPAGFEHGIVAARILVLLGSHVFENKLGRVLAAETGFIIHRGPDTVRAPDVAFISKDRLPETESRGFGTVMPDLLFEVISPSETEDEIAEKKKAWIGAGVACVVNVYPNSQTASVHRSVHHLSEFQADDMIDFSDVVEDWKPQLKTFFGVET